MGLLLDIVPNHMAADPQDPWWNDVLENGRASRYARFFDIDWEPEDLPGLRNRVLRPVLGAPLADCISKRELTLTLDDAGVAVAYYGTRYPLDPATYHLALGPTLGHLAGPAANSLRNVISSSRKIPHRDRAGAAIAHERQRRCESTKAALASALRAYPALRTAFAAAADTPALTRILEAQAYKLEFWRTGVQHINYRRFFDITGLVGLRVEDPEVFAARHDRICELMGAGAISGLRVDHVDGLRDPAGYLRRLRRAVAAADEPYILVEKILSAGEHLPRSWPVAGTTGYEFLDSVNRLFVEPKGLRALEDAWTADTGSSKDFGRVVYEEKKRAIRTLFQRELRSLTRQLVAVAAAAKTGGMSPRAASAAIVEVTAHLPVYRTYMRGSRIFAHDRQLVEQSVAAASKGRRGAAREALAALGRVLTLRFPADIAPPAKRLWIDFVERWQQFTGPAMAKGQEDTAFYVYSPLVSLNEVGSHPEGVSGATDAFHDHNRRIAGRWAHTMNTTSTHDTKRSEDVRARINVLSEVHEDWLAALRRWRKTNAPLERRIAGARVPDPNEELILYQTLLGTWPFGGRVTQDYRARIKAYMVKATREAKVHTSWLDPNDKRESALSAFIDSCLSGGQANPFLRELAAFHGRIAYFGAISSLAQTILKVTAPGVPDFYQGTETWDFSLVDPDNRRPVDFKRLRSMLRGMAGPPAADRARRLLRQWRDGRIKMYVIKQALEFRRLNPDLFQRGRYVRLDPTGPLADHVLAFARVDGDRWSITVVPRLLASIAGVERPPLGDFWDGTSVKLRTGAPKSFANVLTSERLDRSGATLALSECFRDLPVAILHGDG